MCTWNISQDVLRQKQNKAYGMQQKQYYEGSLMRKYYEGRSNCQHLLEDGNPLQCSCLENPKDGEPGGLPSMGSHRVGHDWSDLAAAAATASWKKQESPRKISTSALLTMPKPLTVWITINCGKFFKRWEYQTTLSASWETCMQVKKQQLEPDKEQQTGSKLGKDYVKAIYCHPGYLTYMQSTSCEMMGWMKHKLESRLLGEIPIISDMQMTPPLWQEVKN